MQGQIEEFAVVCYIKTDLKAKILKLLQYIKIWNRGKQEDCFSVIL